MPDYSKAEILEDSTAIDWDMAFNEVESGERLKLDREKKQREAEHNLVLEKQKEAMMKAMKDSELKR